MSWSVSTDAHPAPDIVGAIKHAEPSAHLSEGQRRQLNVAREQAMNLALAQIGDVDPEGDERWFLASMSGHAETDELEGRPGDHVVAKVEQVPRPT